MGRRPIIIPRHKSSSSNVKGLEHPLAVREETKPKPAIGIRRHGQPEAKPLHRKRSPRSVQLEFIPEEDDNPSNDKDSDSSETDFDNDDDDDDDSFFSKFDSPDENNDDDDDNNNLSDLFGDSGDFGSDIAHIDESDDCGIHHLLIWDEDDEDEIERFMLGNSSILSTSSLGKSQQQPLEFDLSGVFSSKAPPSQPLEYDLSRVFPSRPSPSLQTPTPSLDGVPSRISKVQDQRKVLEQEPSSPRLPEDQRRVVLEKYKRQQRNHHLQYLQQQQRSAPSPTQRATEVQQEKVKTDASWKDRLESFRSDLSSQKATQTQAMEESQNQLQEAIDRVQSLEAQLQAAKMHKEDCLRRWEETQEHFRKDAEAKAVQGLHLEILALGEAHPTSKAVLDTTQSTCSLTMDDHTLEEWKVFKHRLEMIKDLMDKANATHELKSNHSTYHQKSQTAMMENAASKYVLFRKRNLI